MEPTTSEMPVQTNSTYQNKTDAVISDLRINPEWMITLALSFLLGFLGVHRFYNGKIGTGLLMLFTFGGLGIWATIDFIIVIFGKFKTKSGTLIPVRIPA